MRPSPRQLRSTLLAGILSLAALPAIANEGGGPPAPEGWNFRLGLAPVYSPDYIGSDDYKLRVFPDIEITYDDWFFVNWEGVGVNLLRQGPLTAGVSIGYDGGRDEDDNRVLRGMGDLDPTAELRLFANYAIGNLGFRANIRGDLLGEGHKGVLAELAVAYVLQPAEGLMMFVGPNVTWADGDYMQSYFGVSERQAATSMFTPYRAKSGVRDVGFTVVAINELGGGWALTAIAGYQRLLGDAADSPLVADVGSANQLFSAVGLSYRF